MNTIHNHSFLLLLLCLLGACGSRPEQPTPCDELPAIFPDYVGVTIPDSIAPLNFAFAGEKEVDAMDVVVVGTRGGKLHANGSFADFDIDEWHALVHQNVGDSLLVSVCTLSDGMWTQYRSFPIYVSRDPIGEWGVTYRRIPPGYESYGNMGIYERSLSTFDEKTIVENKPIDGQCMNCHTPNRTAPTQFTLHIRGEHGATVVGNNGQIDVLAPTNGQLGGGMVYPFWHPSGRFIAYSTNITHQNFHQLSDRRVEVYDDRADIIIYQVASHTLLLDSLVASTSSLENFPAFSPDGCWLYFCTSPRPDSIWKSYQDVKYSICRVGFDEATGRLGQRVDTIVAARREGKSAVMPRLSYDGRFLLYTLCDYGCFPIWHPESDLWMLNLDTGERFALSEANSTEAESFHNWSLNSRWIVFTSRRGDGLYTYLYLAHVAPDGRVSKAFRLPQRSPREFDAENIYSFNTPEFALSPMPLDRKMLYRRLLASPRIPTSLR